MSTRITDLPQAETLNGSEIMPLVQNGVTKKATLDFINLASPAGLILQQTQQVYQDTLGVKSDTEGVLAETQSVLGDTQVVLGQTIAVRNETEAVKIDFETQYLGPHASPPTLDNEGNPLQNGALYWDTSLMAMFVWDGATWTAFSSAVASVNGYIGEVILNFQDVGAAGPGANTNITSLGGLTGDVATATGLQFDTAAPSAGAVGKLTWNTTDQTLDLGISASGVVLRVGQEVYYRVKNGTAGVIPNGSMVRYTGTEGLTGNILVAPALADGTYASQTFLGLMTEVLNPGDSGFATYFGRVRGIDTTGNPYGEVWADGDVIFASALVAGWLTKNPPEAPNNRIRVGIVVHAHPNGVLFVNPTYGGKLSENEQVQLAAIADGDVLQYDAADGRFENRSLTDAGIEPLGAAAASMAAHLLDADPHPQYTTAAEASAAAPVQSVVGKTGAVSLTNADVGLGNVANVLQAAAARVLTAGNGLTGGGDLSADRSFVLGTPSTLTTGTTNTVTATSHTHAVTFPVTSVADKTGAVVLVKADVGLDQVDNTSDANKPVSTATAAALNLKFDKTGGPITGNTNLVVNSASEALRITQTGTGLALRVEDSANADSTPFVVDANGNVGVKTAAPAVSFAVNASDAILVPIGSTANRPTGATGYLRFNTELTQFEGYNGTAWGAIGADDASTVDFQQAGAGAVVRTAQDKMREWVSVKDFGAVGDGVTDDTAACQKAADHARAIGGALVFPSGYTFGIQGLIYIRNGVRGVLGFGGKIKFLSGPLMSGICLAGREEGESSNVSGCLVDGLYFECGSLWGVAIYGQNINTCTITNNVIIGVGDGHGILVRSFVSGLADSYNNIIANNTITGDTGPNPPSFGIAIDSPINVAPYSGADTYWKATFTAADATYKGSNNIVVGNRIIGGYYGISLSAALFNAVVGNTLSFNVRNISVQNNCISNNISNNVLQDSISSAVHLAYGSSYNTISGNQIYTTRANGQGLLQAYVGSGANKFAGNQVVAGGASTPKWHIYCGVHSGFNEFIGNTLRGAASKAYIAVESAWDNTVSNPASFGYGEASDVNGFANAGMFMVSVKENTIFPDSAAPAIFAAQISDGAGNYTLDQCVVQGNTVMNNTPSKQFELLEENSGSLNSFVLKDNAFSTFANAANFTLPRGRAHFRACQGNIVVDDALIEFASGDTTPSVGIGAFFQHQDASATNVTYYDDGVDGQEIEVRLTVFTTLVHNDSFIRLKGGASVTGSSVGGSNAMLTFRRLAGVWFETGRNF